MDITIRIEGLDELTAALIAHNVALRQLAEATAGAKAERIYDTGPATAEVQQDTVPQQEAQEKAEESESLKPSPKKGVSKVELRTLLAELTQAGKGDQVQNLIKQFRAKRFSEIPEEKYPDLWAAAEALK